MTLKEAFCIADRHSRLNAKGELILFVAKTDRKTKLAMDLEMAEALGVLAMTLRKRKGTSHG